MRVTKLGVAVAIAISSMSLYAQTTVQVYGVADAGVEYVNKIRVGAVGSPTERVIRLQSGNAASSRLGFRGSEDLGGGLSSVFVLENGFSIDTGTMSQGGRLFGRQAYVGLAGPAGQVQLGRQTSVIYDFGLVFDPVAPARYSTPVFDPAYVGRSDNAVKYVGRFGGLNVAAQYSFGFDSLIANGGEAPGVFKVGKEMGVHTDYSFRNFKVGAAYDRMNGTSVATQDNKNERIVVGGSIDLNPVRLVAAYQRQEVDAGATSVTNKLYWVGAKYDVTNAFAVLPAVYFSDPEGRSNRSTMFTVFVDYAITKRTDLYTHVAYMKNQDAATAGMGSVVNPGDSQRALTVGMRHRF